MFLFNKRHYHSRKFINIKDSETRGMEGTEGPTKEAEGNVQFCICIPNKTNVHPNTHYDGNTTNSKNFYICIILRSEFHKSAWGWYRFFRLEDLKLISETICLCLLKDFLFCCSVVLSWKTSLRGSCPMSDLAVCSMSCWNACTSSAFGTEFSICLVTPQEVVPFSSLFPWCFISGGVRCLR